MIRLSLLLAGVALLVFVVFRTGPDEIGALLARIGWGFLPLAGIFAGYQAVRAYALHLSASRPEAVSFADVLRIRLSGEAVQFFTSTGPFIALPSKAFLLGRRGLTTTEGFAATIGEGLAYSLVSAVMLVGAWLYLLSHPAISLGTGVRSAGLGLLALGVSYLVGSAVAIHRRIYFIGAFVGLLRRLPGVRRLPGFDAGAVRHMEDVLLGVLRDRPGQVARLFAVEACAHALLVLELWWVLRMTDVDSHIGDALVLESAGKFISVVFFFIPGQVGASEGVSAVLFGVLGLPAAAGVGVVLARRIRSLLAAGAGLAAVALITRRR